jgi:hypothetical protein
MNAPSILERSRAAWGGTPPAWIEALALACDAATQNQVAQRIGYSPTVVSQTLSNVYVGDLTAVQTAVEGALMGATVACPVLGSLGSDLCQQHQRAGFSSTNPLRIQLYRACRSGCAQSRLTDDREPGASSPSNPLVRTPAAMDGGWLGILRAYVEQCGSIKLAAQHLGYSRPAISMALNGKYKGETTKLRARVMARCSVMNRNGGI